MSSYLAVAKILSRATRVRPAIWLASDLAGLVLKGYLIKRQREGGRHYRAERPRLFDRREETRKIEPGNKVNVPIKLLEGGAIPHKAYEYDGGDDLALSQEFTAPPRLLKYAPTGIMVAIPPGHIGLITERSSLGKPDTFPGAEYIWVRTGVLDPGYRGEVKLRVHNLGDKPVTIPAKTTMAQMILIPIAYARYVLGDLPPSERGEKGFGSSGSKLSAGGAR